MIAIDERNTSVMRRKDEEIVDEKVIIFKVKVEKMTEKKSL